MNPSDPLAELRGIHLPEAVSWWPLAPGWWLLCAILLISIFSLIRIGITYYFNRSYRRQALEKLKQLPDSNQQQRLVALFHLLKQVASCAYPNQNFASLNNQDFIKFLHDTGGKSAFDTLPENWQSLFYAQNNNVPCELVSHLVACSRLWIKQHPTQLIAEQLERYKSC